jgi:hypothetical protein
VAWDATARGAATGRGTTRLVLTLWLVNLALALAAGLPQWLALKAAMGPLPGADALGESLRFGVLSDLSELHPGIVTGFGRAALAAFGLGLLVAIATTGGSLEVLMSGDERSFAHRFGRGAGRFFARFLRLELVSLVLGLLLMGVLGGPLLALSRYLRRESGSEWLAMTVWLGAVLAAGLGLLLTLLAQDAARVRVVREDPRRVLPLVLPSFGLVLRHPAKWLRVWSWNALLLLAAFALYMALASAVPSSQFLFLLVLLQQVFVLVRCKLRVSLLGAEVGLVSTLRPLPPPPAPVPQDEPVLLPPVEPGPTAASA